MLTGPFAPKIGAKSYREGSQQRPMQQNDPVTSADQVEVGDIVFCEVKPGLEVVCVVH